jgi:hypothetical protein
MMICQYQDGEQQRDLLMENQYDVDPLFGPSCSLTEFHLISQVDLSDLIHNLNLPKYQLVMSPIPGFVSLRIMTQCSSV